jgi:DNA-binding response OmpR family regulator
VNVLFLGNHLLAQRMLTALSREDIKLTYITDPEFAILQTKLKSFDLVLVDCSMERIEHICEEICGSAFVPIILVTDEEHMNWKTAGNIDSDGFINADASDAELLARVKALYKRFSIKSRKVIV